MSNSLGSVDLSNRITRSSRTLIKGEKEVETLNGVKRYFQLWTKWTYRIEFEKQIPQLYADLANLIEINPVQTLIMDKDPWNTAGGVLVYCKLGEETHTAGSVVQNQDNYRISWILECEMINPI